MSKKETLPFRCACEKAYVFEETFPVEGPGSTVLQVPCPNPQCPGKNQMLTLTVPFKVKGTDTVFRYITPSDFKP